MEKLLTEIPAGYRRLKTNEKFRAGDLYYSKSSPEQIHTVTGWNKSVAVKDYNQQYHTSYVFFRKRTVDTQKTVTVAEVSKAKKVTVQFEYPRNGIRWNDLVERTVELISMDDTYVTGLEKTNDKWQFKRFIRSKIPYRHVNVISFQ